MGFPVFSSPDILHSLTQAQLIDFITCSSPAHSINNRDNSGVQQRLRLYLTVVPWVVAVLLGSVGPLGVEGTLVIWGWVAVTLNGIMDTSSFLSCFLPMQ